MNGAGNRQDCHYDFARLAVDKAKLCPIDATSPNPVPRVAVVIAMGDRIVGWAAKGVGGEFLNDGAMHPFNVDIREHAEKALLAKLDHLDLTGAAAYVTLEPCTKRKTGPSCAELLATARVSAVYIGNVDPNPDIGALAWRRFHSEGIAVRDFPGDLRNEARRDNDLFFRKFRWSHKDRGDASFDYDIDEGKRTLGPIGKEFLTRWTSGGPGSIHACAHYELVGLARHCTEFEQVDDPGRWLEGSTWTTPVNVGEIVVFRNEQGFALVKVLAVTVRDAAAGVNSELHIKYELRYCDIFANVVERNQ